MLIKLIAGDWSGDGHDKIEERLYESNLSKEEVEAAIKKAVADLNLETPAPNGETVYFLPFCMQYQDSYCQSEADAEKLGLEVTHDNPAWKYEFDYRGDCNDWFDIHIKLAEAGNPDLVITEVKTTENIIIGGYGLFYM